jgi:hypothetical protein
MTSNPETMLRFVHQSNIERYRRILETYLTGEERAFVAGRLAEEQSALQKLAGEISPHK